MNAFLRRPGHARARLSPLPAPLAAAAAALCLAACFEATAPGGPGPEETTELATSFALASGKYTLKAVHSGKCVDVAAAGIANGTKIQQWNCNGTAAQQWNLRDLGGGVYEVKAAHSGKCADVSGRGTANGAKVHQWDCHGGTNQQWRLVDMGSSQYQLRAVHSNKCLDVSGVSTADGAALHQWTCYNVGNQKFTISPVAGDGGGGGIVWRPANLTWYTSYPDPGSEECIKYNGCTWAGYFAGVSGKQPESWVAANNIAAVHEKDWATYKLKTLRIRQGTRQIDAKVYDMCSDSDCNGCCTRNAGAAGFLIDLESYTKNRFGSGSGTVEWYCLDCK